MPPKLKLSAKDSAGTRPLFSVIIRSDAPVPPGLDTTYDKWSRQDYKSIPGGSYSTLHHFLLHQAELRGLATSQQNQKNAFLKFLMIKYDNLLSDDNKLPPTRRKTLPTLAADALKYTNHHSIEVAAVEETTGGEVAGPGLEMPPVQQLTGRLRDMAEAIRKCNKRPKKKWKNLQMKMMMRLKKRRESAGARRRSPSL